MGNGNESTRNSSSARRVIKTQRVVRKRTVVTSSGKSSSKSQKNLVSGNGNLQSFNDSTSDSTPLGAIFQRESIASSPFLVRFLFFEVLLTLGLVISLGCHQAILYHKAVLHPYLQTMKWNHTRAEQEETYYRFECTAQDITADTVQDLFVNTSIEDNDEASGHHLKFSPMEAVDKAMTHGAVVLPQLLSPETASNLRKHVGKRLRNLDQTESIEVIMGDHRWSFALRATEHTSVANALTEIGNHPYLQRTIEGLVGAPAALMELQVIVSIEGAPSQFWHADSEPEGSSARFGNSFVPLYTLLIPLQDTTPAMGATAVCPGSHRCHYTNACLGFGDTMADASNWTKASGMGVQVTDPKTGVWKAGTGLLYNSQTQHHGSGHSQGEARAALLLSFSAAPRFGMLEQPQRLPAIGTVYAIYSNHLGFLFDDLKDPYSRMQSPWKRTLGWLDEHQGRGWNMPLLDSFRTINDQFGFRLEDLTKESVHGSLQHQVAGIFGIYLDRKEKSILAPMENLMVRLLGKILSIGFFLAIVVFLLYLWGMSAMPTGALQLTLLRLLVVFIFLCWYNMYTVAETNRSAQKVRASIKAATLANYNQGIHVDPHSLTMPRYHDILFPNVNTSDRSIGAQSLAIEFFHPGTKRWHETTKAQTAWFFAYSGLPVVFQEAVLVNVVDLSMTQDGFRFLERDPKTSDWSVLEMDSILRRTRYRLQLYVMSQVSHLGWIEPRTPCDRLDNGTPICRMLEFDIIFHRETKAVAQEGQVNHSFARKIKSWANLPKQMKTNPEGVSQHKQEKSDYHKTGTAVEFLPRSGNSRKWTNGIIVSSSSNAGENRYTLEYLDVEKTREDGIPERAIRLPEQLKPLRLFHPMAMLRQDSASKIFCGNRRKRKLLGLFKS